MIGKTHGERFGAYYSFRTPWRYLRFDRGDPPFLAAALLAGRTLGNPFYYDRRPEAVEALQIDRALLRRMIADRRPIVLGFYDRPAALQVVDPGALLDSGRTRSLLIVKSPGSPPTEGVILPLSVALPGQPRLVERRWARSRSAALAPYRLLPGASATAVVDLPGLNLEFWSRTLVHTDAIETLLGSPVSGRIELDLGDQPVLQGTRAGDRFVLRPLAGRLYWFRGAGTRQAADLPSEGSGSIELELRHQETRKRVPLLPRLGATPKAALARL